MFWPFLGKKKFSYSTFIGIMSEQLITISPGIVGGTPVFYNTRVPIKNLFDYLKGGDSLEDF